MGPEMCITDDSNAERAAIHSTSPSAARYALGLSYSYAYFTTFKVGRLGYGMGNRGLPVKTDHVPILIEKIKPSSNVITLTAMEKSILMYLSIWKYSGRDVQNGL